ncbi:MAG: hypothetical protein CBC13_03890 [Planctomycetia bacterium TMED53]|nr:MAG: hypothetical protein CBC13_03890 [Planctomycetia bacterium TMED53]
MNDSWRNLISGDLDFLVNLAKETPPDDVSAVSSLRKHGSLEEVSVVLEVLEARRRASGRLRDAKSWFMDKEGVEQSTRTVVAEHKAKRFRSSLGESPVIDLCCGIGSDTTELARNGSVIYVDRNPLKVELTRYNLSHSLSSSDQHHPLVADAGVLPLPPFPIHLDPSRRQGSRRRHDYSGMVPGPNVIEELLSKHGSIALKCGPGINADDLPPGSIEWIQDGPDLVEATLWCGDLATADRRSATLVDRQLTVSGELQPVSASTLEKPAYLHEPCPAIERSGLMGQLQSEVSAAEWHPGLGWLAGETAQTNPWFRSFAVIAQMGWHEKKVIDWFNQQGKAPASIKTRGTKEDPARLIRRFSGDPSDWVLALLRRGQKIEACVLEELTPEQSQS